MSRLTGYQVALFTRRTELDLQTCMGYRIFDGELCSCGAWLKATLRKWGLPTEA